MCLLAEPRITHLVSLLINSIELIPGAMGIGHNAKPSFKLFVLIKQVEETFIAVLIDKSVN